MPVTQTAVRRWPPLQVTRIRETLDDLSALLDDQMRKSDPELVAAPLARLLVVRSCGYLEQVMFEVSRAYIVERSGGQVRTFAQTWIPDGRNPWPAFLLEWVGRFDAAMATDLAVRFQADDERLHRELSFLVNRRNRIAHGLNEGVTTRKAFDLKAVACELADWFVLRFNPAVPFTAVAS
jgi:hypothetical protein